MAFILETANNRLVEAEIILAKSNDMPLKKDDWNFNWRQLFKEHNTQTFILRTKQPPHSIEGVLHLMSENEMLVMDVLEIAPGNIGRRNKKYDNVAGCLVAFACRESFKIEGAYKGYLTFVSKTNLIEWYINKYGAEKALGQRMFIDPAAGLSLIGKYLERKNKRNHEKK